MAFFAALLPTLLKAIMGSGAVAIPAMTGAAGAAGGTVGGAIPDSVVTAEGAPMETGAGPFGARAGFCWCSRQESNLHRNLRKVVSYPLNDESVGVPEDEHVAPL